MPLSRRRSAAGEREPELGQEGPGKWKRVPAEDKLENFIHLSKRELGKSGIFVSIQFFEMGAQKSLPSSLFKGRRAFLNALDKRFLFFPLWSGGKPTPQGDLTAF